MSVRRMSMSAVRGGHVHAPMRLELTGHVPATDTAASSAALLPVPPSPCCSACGNRRLVQHEGDTADMPAAKLRPAWPSTTTVPPVMYSQPWSPTPRRRQQRRSCARQNAHQRRHGNSTRHGSHIKHRVADDDVVFRLDLRALADRQQCVRPTGPCDIVVGIAFELEGHAMREPRTKTLSSGAFSLMCMLSSGRPAWP